jgi:site-specific DNA-methyltransferase (adenine-specific)
LRSPLRVRAADQNSKQKSTAAKYSSAKTNNPLPDFEGDSKDQRSWTHWMAEWLSEARRVCRQGAPICMFIDWRQLPAMTDALQWAGWLWRGTLVWDKTNSRPQRGRFRQQAEFVVWGSNGHMPLDRKAPVLPGVFRQAMPALIKRIHQTEKPLGVMREMVHIVEPGGIILDPFAGAGTTILAAKLEGYPPSASRFPHIMRKPRRSALTPARLTAKHPATRSPLLSEGGDIMSRFNEDKATACPE